MTEWKFLRIILAVTMAHMPGSIPTAFLVARRFGVDIRAGVGLGVAGLPGVCERPSADAGGECCDATADYPGEDTARLSPPPECASSALTPGNKKPTGGSSLPVDQA